MKRCAPRQALTPEERRLDALFAHYERVVDAALEGLRYGCGSDARALRAVDALVNRSRDQFAVSRAHVRHYKDPEPCTHASSSRRARSRA